MFEYNGTSYDLKYNLKRIEMIEAVIKKPLMEIMQKGMMSVTELKVMVSYGAIKEGMNAYEPPKKALLMVDALLEEQGSYQLLSDCVAEALQRDCSFFFPAA